MMLQPKIETIRFVADVIRTLRLSRESYTDLMFYPPPDDPKERQLGFFISMVAIDHRTSTEMTIFRGRIDGKPLRGADLLYHLGVRIYHRDENSFTPNWLQNLTPKDAKEFLCIGKECVWDFFTRIFLLRDLGRKTSLIYGSFSDLLRVSNVDELAIKLRVFRAYEDPILKKTFLLAKFLDGRDLIHLNDKENFQVPVDNHLTRIAIRLGIVSLTEELANSIKRGIELTREADEEVRLGVRNAWKEVSRRSGADPFALDDFLWPLGRTVCMEMPRCDVCPFSDVCSAHIFGKFLREPKHTLTWYY